ncbi:hypothetical protein JCM8547_008088 [Rhodosporidiobolus lusitaniae]
MVALALSVLALLATGASASPVAVLNKRTASSGVGQATSDVYPPTGTTVNTAIFPDESVVGYQQATNTGVEPFLAATGAAYPTRTGVYPLVVPQPSSTGTASSSKKSSDESSFNILAHVGNLSPQFSVDSSVYGLAGASPSIPDKCEIVQWHTLFRHGARYPTSGAAPQAFAEKVANASLTADSFIASGPLEFLNDWTYKLGAELLTPYGRLQNFQYGVAARQLYGHLLNNYTETGTLPVFRTQSQDRMVKTMQNFAAGFFGVPEFLEQVNIEITVETTGANNTGSPYSVCTNSNNARGSVGSTAATAFVKPYYEKTAARLNQYLSGNLTIEETDVSALLQTCAYETDALGYSSFCSLFTEEEFNVFEQAYDLQFSGNNGFNSPVAAAQGKGFVEEFIARLENHVVTTYDSTTNSTLDGNETTFPLNQSLYVDAAHEVSIMDIMTALNLTALSETVPTDKLSTDHTYVASRIVPFGTILQMQVLECQPSVPTKQIRFILNDAVLPIHESYEGCNTDFNGLCAVDTVLAALHKRLDSIDFDYDCFGNWTVPTYGEVTDGRALRA